MQSIELSVFNGGYGFRVRIFSDTFIYADGVLQSIPSVKNSLLRLASVMV